MKLLFKTSNPDSFKKEIYEKIENHESDTWEIKTIDSEKYLKQTGNFGAKGVIKLTPDNTNGNLIVQVKDLKILKKTSRLTIWEDSVNLFLRIFLTAAHQLPYNNKKTAPFGRGSYI